MTQKVRLKKSEAKAMASAAMKPEEKPPGNPTMVSMIQSSMKLQGKLDALVDGKDPNEPQFLPAWESPDEGSPQRQAQIRALRALVNCGTITAACRMAGVTRGTFNRWMEKDLEFKAAFEYATEEVVDDLEEIAILRAKSGSDMMMQTMLKAMRPEKFGDKRRVEMTGKDGEPITVRVVGARAMLAKKLKALVSGPSGEEEVEAEVMES